MPRWTKNSAKAKKALADGLKRYFGDICKKHPEMNGERNARNRGCIGCNKEKMRERRAQNPEYHKSMTRAAHVKRRGKFKEEIKARERERRTGFTKEIYDGLMVVQNNSCAICCKNFSLIRPHADHCHENMTPRGILCQKCNQVEGMIKSIGLSPRDFGERLSKYLETPPARKLLKIV